MKGTEVMAMPRDVVFLSDDQFNKLVELLTPGYECAKLMLADRAAYSTPPETAPTPPIEPIQPIDPPTGAEAQAALASNQASA